MPTMKPRRFSLQSILLLISFLFLVMPLGSLYFLKIYESALVRQTESELISQAAFVAALYKNEVQRLLIEQKINPTHYGKPLTDNPSSTPFKKLSVHLDLAHSPIYPPRPQGEYTADHLDPIAQQAGQKIIPVLKEAQQITLSGIKVLDYQGIVAAGQEENGLSFARSQEFKDAKKGKPTSLLRDRRMPKSQASLNSLSRNSHFNVFVAMPIQLHNHLIGVVWLNRTPTDLWQALYNKKRDLGLSALLVITLTLLISMTTAYTITRPIQKLVRQTRLISQGHQDGLKPLETPVTREIAELSESIAKMAQTIQQRSEYLQHFTAHVSHALKSPLTGIQGAIELLQDNRGEMSLSQQQRFLTNIGQDTERLNQLVQDLLQLAKANLSDSSPQTTALIPLLEELKERYPNQVTLVKPHFPETLMISISPQRLNACLNILIENSLQAGATQIMLYSQKELSMVVITLHDNGSGISEGNQKNLFTPFFTTKANDGGSGLGLSIAQALLGEGRLKFETTDQPGACFTLHLPLV